FVLELKSSKRGAFGDGALAALSQDVVQAERVAVSDQLKERPKAPVPRNRGLAEASEILCEKSVDCSQTLPLADESKEIHRRQIVVQGLFELPLANARETKSPFDASEESGISLRAGKTRQFGELAFRYCVVRTVERATRCAVACPEGNGTGDRRQVCSCLHEGRLCTFQLLATEMSDPVPIGDVASGGAGKQRVVSRRGETAESGNGMSYRWIVYFAFESDADRGGNPKLTLGFWEAAGLDQFSPAAKDFLDRGLSRILGGDSYDPAHGLRVTCQRGAVEPQPQGAPVLRDAGGTEESQMLARLICPRRG